MRRRRFKFSCFCFFVLQILNKLIILLYILTIRFNDDDEIEDSINMYLFKIFLFLLDRFFLLKTSY